jgi:hypothetical protein
VKQHPFCIYETDSNIIGHYRRSGIAASLVFPAVDSIAQETSLLRQGIDEVSSGDGTAAADNQSDSTVLPVFSTAINTDAVANAVASATTLCCQQFQ